MIYGNELIIDLKKCKNITRKSLNDFIIKLCKLIDMKRWDKTQIVYFGQDRFKGYSIMQFITTSSVVGHFTKENAYINIFSCKEFDIKETVKFIKDWFLTSHCIHKFIRR